MTYLFNEYYDPDLRIREEFLSISAINPFLMHDSAPRGCMFAMQFTQAVVVKGSEPRIIQTGIESQLKDNTYKIEIEQDFMVRSIILSDPNKSIEDNSHITIIGINIHTAEAECYQIPKYFSLHQYFGFSYVKNIDLIEGLTVGQVLEKGTILADSPGVVDGVHTFGVNADIALIADPASGQDGVIASTDLMESLAYDIFVSGSAEWGTDSFPLNIHGDKHNYKAFLEVGESVGPDNIVCGIRTFDKSIAPGISSVNDTLSYDPAFDKLHYVKPTKYLNCNGDKIINNEVIEAKITYSPKNKKDSIYNQEQTSKLVEEHKVYQRSIIKAYKNLGRKHEITTPRFQRQLVEAMSRTDTENRIVFKFRNEPSDLYRIEYVIRYRVVPGIGSKISDIHGAKGIVVDVRDPKDMPVDKYGNRAQVIMDPTSIPGRMNAGRLYDVYFGAASRNMKRIITEKMGKDYKNVSDEKVHEIYDLVLEFYANLYNHQYEYYKKVTSIDVKKEIIYDIIENEAYIDYRCSNEKGAPNFVIENEKHPLFKVPREPIYINGEKTEKSITIGNIYIMLLSKTADGYLASSSPYTNHYGIPVRVSKVHKGRLPYINNPTKVLGETEGRLFSANAISPVLAAEYKDRASSMTTHEHIYKNILQAEQPTNIDKIIDRDQIPYGDDNALKLLKGIFHASGIDFNYVEGKK